MRKTKETTRRASQLYCTSKKFQQQIMQASTVCAAFDVLQINQISSNPRFDFKSLSMRAISQNGNTCKSPRKEQIDENKKQEL